MPGDGQHHLDLSSTEEPYLREEQALFLTHTDVDNTGKSYYGETNLYLVSLDGSFDGMVDLGKLGILSNGKQLKSSADKEGPIYDFNWNPTSREFVVCYGCERIVIS